MRNTHKFGLALCATIALSTALPATSSAGEMSQQALKDMATYDQNRDGMISQEEISGTYFGNVSIAAFKSFDFDHDGIFNAQEFSAFADRNYKTALTNYQSIVETKLKNELAQAEAEAYNNAAMKKVEQFNDGRKVYMTMDFAVYDRNRDRFIDFDELKSKTHAANPDEIIASYDANTDGKLDIMEFKRYVNSDPMIAVDAGEVSKGNL